MKRAYLLTPFLFTLAFLLSLYYWVLTIASPDQLIRLLLILWGLLGLLIYPAYLITRDWKWTSALLTIFVFGFFFSEAFFQISGILVVVGFALWQVFFRLRKFRIVWDQFFFLLDGIAVFLIIVALYQNIQVFATIPWSTYLTSVNNARNYSLENIGVPATKPDIYYIVLDGYPRSDILRELYGYDNTPFVTYLQEKGFIVPANVHSNYAKTAVSIPSTLNMDYVDSFSPGLEDSHFWWQTKPFIEHSRVRVILEQQGYKTFSLSTGWGPTDDSTTDFYLHPFPIALTDYERFILGDTPLGYIQPAIEKVASVPSFETQRIIILHSLQSLRNMPESTEPSFVFAHITAPHPPFVFDRDGNAIDPAGHFNSNDAADFGGSTSDYINGYVGQVEFINSQMQIVLDSILKRSRIPPIIVIQADHGSALLTDFASAENTCIKERFSPFAAYYLPDANPQVIPPNLSAVNLFRIIFNQYFQADLPLLENRQYYFKDKIYLYRFVDVTSRVDDECSLP